MKKISTILAITFSVLAIILAVLPVSNLAIIPVFLAFIFDIYAFYLSKKTGQIKKIIQFTFFLTIIALSISIYKSIFTTTQVSSTKGLEETEAKLEEEAIDELESLEIDDFEIDESELENIDLE